MRLDYHKRFFFFNDTAPTEIYTLSLHDALPISRAELDGVRQQAGDHLTEARPVPPPVQRPIHPQADLRPQRAGRDRKSTRLNSSHSQISYAVFCLKKKKTHTAAMPRRCQVDPRL